MTIDEMIANKAQLIELKKGAVKYTDVWQSNVIKVGDQIKAERKLEDNDNEVYRTVVGNTYYWMDGHEDVHVKGCFSNSIKQKASKVFHLHDHEYKLTSRVGDPQEITEKDISWRDLGVDIEGETTSLLMLSKIRKDYNSSIYSDYKNMKIDQHSVGMRYIKVDLAVNDEKYPEEKKNWDEVYPLLANKEAAHEKGYFWIIKEASLIEISAVLMGSNPITGTLQPEKSTEEIKDEAADALLKSKVEFYKQLRNGF